MNVTLIRFTPEPDKLCGEAAALCTGYDGDPINALRGAMGSGHENVAEHAVFTFRIEDVSRSLLAQLTRHRIASFSVQSQRYCGIPHNAVVPESVRNASSYVYYAFMDAIASSHDAYDWLVDNGIPAEDARMVVPEGELTKLIMTMNARELRHFFSLRCCNRAQWEIRRMAWLMLDECLVVAPELFRDAGPGCVRGACPEGKRSCGKPYTKGEDKHDA
ncbi:MAG: FAD-dependent thymidylate synthase [Candidatus Ventricola sp.]